jgi:hypothetical protein
MVAFIPISSKQLLQRVAFHLHGPNLQNIPVRTEEGRKIRNCFTVGKGYVALLTGLKWCTKNAKAFHDKCENG